MAFSNILIANRGEIAVRVMRTAARLGYRTTAIYSEPDAASPHVAMADRSIALGGATARESYLDVAKVIAAAKTAGADAIHPGYGFLSERTDFAAACEDAGITFIGPPAAAIATMGDKRAARQALAGSDVPVVPGYDGPEQGDAGLLEEATRIGFPIMVKAAAGGGGRGMRRVNEPEGLAEAIRIARAEAEASFGDGTLMLERCIVGGRHVEIQIIADEHGQVAHLGERDCSTQRRFQKIIEECPSPAVDSALRKRMGDAAIVVARTCDYRGVGTVEFLLDDDGEFYFLEMNTRIQVEHGITEEVYGVDLIAQMIRVAAGESIDDCVGLVPRGHAIEVRLNAEDPDNNFLPSLGTIRNLRWPGGPGVRIDSGVYSGMEVTPYYDSMLAKLIAYGRDREQARRRMLRMLQELHVGGVKTSAGIALQVLQSEGFCSGEYDTGFLERFIEERSDHEVRREIPDDLEQVAAMVAALHRQKTAARRVMTSLQVGSRSNPWIAAARQEQHGSSPR